MANKNVPFVSTVFRAVFLIEKYRTIEKFNRNVAQIILEQFRDSFARLLLPHSHSLSGHEMGGAQPRLTPQGFRAKLVLKWI